LAWGKPAPGFAWNWSVYGWIEGMTASSTELAGDAAFGGDLARFLVALNGVEVIGGPVAGRHNFHRGGALTVYDEQARRAVAVIEDRRLATHAEAIWTQAVSSAWREPPVWLHGDFAPLNILVRGGKLAAVIDWGSAGIGDPACDLAIAWTFLRGDGQQAFAAGLPYDRQTWERGRGWALWKAMILATGVEPGPAAETQRAWRTLETIVETDLPT
jgi:aminoglycoside phosphotransferase (APT) family kinase protein